MAQTTQAVHLIMQLVSPLGQFLSDIDSHTDALHRTHGTALKHPPTISQQMMAAMTDRHEPPPPACPCRHHLPLTVNQWAMMAYRHQPPPA